MAERKKVVAKSNKPTKVFYTKGRLVIEYGSTDDLVVETDDAVISCDLEDFVTPTEDEVKDAIDALLEG